MSGENDGFPRGWIATSLEGIASDISYGYTSKSNKIAGAAKMLRITDIQDNNVDWGAVPFCEISDDDKSRYLLRSGDLVFARTGATVGKSFLIRDEIRDTVFASYLIRVRCLDREAGRYLSFFFNSPGYWDQITEFSAGVGQPNVNGTKLKALTIPLAPFAEQKRIADKLEVLLGRVDACRARLDRLSPLLKRFRQSVLSAATSGKLTEEWREENGVNGGWKEVAVGSVIERVEAGLNVRCEERPPLSCEKGLVKISAVTWGAYDDDESKTLPSDAKISEAIKINIGDFLISRANTIDLVGACVIVHEALRPVYLSDKVLRLVMPDAMKPWMLIVLRSPYGRQQIESQASGNQLSMRNLAQANLRQIVIPLPSSKECDEIVRRVEALFAFADSIESRLAEARKTIERLTPAILAKAFRGELVPQDPADEPAAILLERLRQLNGEAAAAKSKRGRRAKK